MYLILKTFTQMNHEISKDMQIKITQYWSTTTAGSGKVVLWIARCTTLYQSRDSKYSIWPNCSKDVKLGFPYLLFTVMYLLLNV